MSAIDSLREKPARKVQRNEKGPAPGKIEPWSDVMVAGPLEHRLYHPALKQEGPPFVAPTSGGLWLWGLQGG